MIGNLILALGLACCCGAPLVSDSELQPKNVTATPVSVLGMYSLEYNGVTYECYGYGDSVIARTPTIQYLEDDNLNPSNYGCVYIDNSYNQYTYYNRSSGNNPFSVDDFGDFITRASISHLSHDFPVYWQSLLIRRTALPVNKVYFESITYFAFYKDVITYNGSNYIADALNIGFNPSPSGSLPLTAQLVSVYEPSVSLGGFVTDSNYAIGDCFVFSDPVLLSNATLTGDNDIYYSPYAIHTIIEISTSDYADIENNMYYLSRLNTTCDLLYNFNDKGYGGYYYSIGYQDGLRNGYNNGYTEGLSVGTSGNQDVKLLFGVIADTPIRFLKQMFNFELFGMNVAVIILSCLTAVCVFTLIKKVWK